MRGCIKSEDFHKVASRPADGLFEAPYTSETSQQTAVEGLKASHKLCLDFVQPDHS